LRVGFSIATFTKGISGTAICRNSCAAMFADFSSEEPDSTCLSVSELFAEIVSGL
jgi:hypothetical protein